MSRFQTLFTEHPESWRNLFPASRRRWFVWFTVFKTCPTELINSILMLPEYPSSSALKMSVLGFGKIFMDLLLVKL